MTAVNSLCCRYIREQAGVKTAGLDYPVRNLSGGNQQRWFWPSGWQPIRKCSFWTSPREALIWGQMEIYRLVVDAAEQGLGIVLISSELAEVLGLADRVLVMRAGCIVGEFDPREVDQETILARAMGVA